MAHDKDLSAALSDLVALGLLPEEEGRRVEETLAKLAERAVYVAVVGDFKRGKSTLINALLGDAVLPVGVVPVTAVPTLCRWGSRGRLLVRMAEEETERPLAELAQYVTEAGNPGNRRAVLEVVVEHPSILLRDGLVLADTPGTGSVHLHNTEAARAFLPRVDVSLVVLTVDAPLSEAEARLVVEAANDAARVAVCLNKIDLLSPVETEEAMRFVGAGIARLLENVDVPVFPVSARVALADGADDGGTDALRAWLRDRIATERSAIARQRALHVAGQAHELAAAALRMERAALEMPVDTATLRRQALRDALDALELDAREAGAVLLDARRRIAAGTIAEAADAVRRALPERLLASGGEETWPDVERETAESWTGDLEEQMTAALSPALRRHAHRLEERVQRFVDVAAELFSVDLPPAPRLADTLTIPPIRVEVADEPGALAMGIRGLREHLPGRLGERWREVARREAAAEAADRLAGRLRYAADRALERAVRAWTRAAEEQWRAVGEALGGAIDRSQRALAAGLDAKEAASQRLETLSERLDRISVTLQTADEVGG